MIVPLPEFALRRTGYSCVVTRSRPYLGELGQHAVLTLPHHAEAEDELLRVGFAGAQDAAGVAEAMEGELVG